MSNSTQSPAIKNIYQRMVDVQKAVTTVFKNETVKMSDNDKGYKAVTHDDVAAALHLPLAEHGVFMFPDIVEYKTDSFEKMNQWNKLVTWYRTDIKIKVKWINVDNPSDFIEGTSAAFALDTSDKSFAKAYSLALKIILLKVHLLESKDNEEQRPFDDANGGERAGKDSSKGNKGGSQDQKKNNQQLQSKPQDQKPNLKPSDKPLEVVMPFGDVKGKKLGELESPMLSKIESYLTSEIAKKPKNLNDLLLLKLNVSEAIKLKKEIVPELPDDRLPEDQLSPEVESQDQEDPFDYVIPSGLFQTEGVDDMKLSKVPEAKIRAVIKEIDSLMAKPKELSGITVSELFNMQSKLKAFLKSVGV